MVDFEELSRKCEFPVGVLAIKNKGSIVKLGGYYFNLYALLLERYGFRCQETRYVQTFKDDGIESREWDWFGYRAIDNFARLRIDVRHNFWTVKADKVGGFISVKYTIELDYKKLWRNNSTLKWMLPIYLRRYYWGRALLGYYVRFNEELGGVKELIKKELNVLVYD